VYLPFQPLTEEPPHEIDKYSSRPLHFSQLAYPYKHTNNHQVVVREDFSKQRCDSLVSDIKMALSTLVEMDKAQVEKYKQHVSTHTRARHGHKKKNPAENMKDNHSLQAKHDKSHPIC